MFFSSLKNEYVLLFSVNNVNSEPFVLKMWWCKSMNGNLTHRFNIK